MKYAGYWLHLQTNAANHWSYRRLSIEMLNDQLHPPSDSEVSVRANVSRLHILR